MAGIVMIACGVFLSVLGIVSMVKIIQIAEDVRYIRSKSDIHVQRPKSWKYILGMCALVSLIVIVLAVSFMLANASMIAAIGR